MLIGNSDRRMCVVTELLGRTPSEIERLAGEGVI